LLLRKPLLFDQLEGDRVWSPTTTSKRHTHRRPAVPDGFTAMSGHVMTLSESYQTGFLYECPNFSPALAANLRSQRTAMWGDSNVHCCSHHCQVGRCYWTDRNDDEQAYDWQGQEGLRESGTLGLLLDLVRQHQCPQCNPRLGSVNNCSYVYILQHLVIFNLK